MIELHTIAPNSAKCVRYVHNHNAHYYEYLKFQALTAWNDFQDTPNTENAFGAYRSALKQMNADYPYPVDWFEVREATMALRVKAIGERYPCEPEPGIVKILIGGNRLLHLLNIADAYLRQCGYIDTEARDTIETLRDILGESRQGENPCGLYAPDESRNIRVSNV